MEPPTILFSDIHVGDAPRTSIEALAELRLGTVRFTAAPASKKRRGAPQAASGEERPGLVERWEALAFGAKLIVMEGEMDEQALFTPSCPRDINPNPEPLTPGRRGAPQTRKGTPQERTSPGRIS